MYNNTTKQTLWSSNIIMQWHHTYHKIIIQVTLNAPVTNYSLIGCELGLLLCNDVMHHIAQLHNTNDVIHSHCTNSQYTTQMTLCIHIVPLSQHEWQYLFTLHIFTIHITHVTGSLTGHILTTSRSLYYSTVWPTYMGIMYPSDSTNPSTHYLFQLLFGLGSRTTAFPSAF